MKGYPVISNRPQKRWVRHRRSGAFRNPSWEPTDIESNTYVLVGEEIEREWKTIFRIGWKESYRNGRKSGKDQQHIMDVQYWDVVAEFQQLVSTEEYDFEDLELAIKEFGWELGDEKIHKRIYKLFPTEEKALFVEERVFAKWLPMREKIVREYVATEEFKVWLVCEVMRSQKREERRAAEEERKRERSQQHTNSYNRSSRTENDIDREMAQQIFKAGYRRLALKFHPDQGGNAYTMRLLITTNEGLKKEYGH
jgi:hypothetical protein